MSKRETLARILRHSGLGAITKWSWSGILTLNFHRIVDPADCPLDHGLCSATPEEFDAQMTLLKSMCDVIRPEDQAACLRKGRGRFAMVTFDDGYRDNYTTAYPILKARSLPATFFIATGFIDHPSIPWWDEIARIVHTTRCVILKLPAWLKNPLAIDAADLESAIRVLHRRHMSLPPSEACRFLDDLRSESLCTPWTSEQVESLWMTWDMLREMMSAGMTIGGHTVSHPMMSSLNREQQQSEIERCADRLTQELGRPMMYFSYPFGHRDAFDANSRELLRRAGVQNAFSYYGGYLNFKNRNWDDFEVPRTAVETYVTRDWFRAILTLPQVYS